MPRLLAAFLLAALLAPSQAQTVDVTFRFIPDLTPPAPPSVVRAFVPGSFNGWGPNTNGQIATGAPSQMVYEPVLGEYRYTTALTVGGRGNTSDPPGGYTYKVHYHTNAAGTAFQWITDPLGAETFGSNNDSVVRAADPMAFQLAREQNTAGEVVAVSAGLFGTQAFTSISFTVNADTYTTAQITDTGDGIFRLVLPTPVAPGSFFRVDATDAGGRTATAQVGQVPPTVMDAPVPAGLRDGINLDPADATRATLVLRAPGKSYIYAVGDFSNWEARPEYVLKRDAADPLGTRWWVELTGLTPGTPVRFQYLVDGVLRVSDPYAPLVLDQGSDPAIPSVTFPNRPPYPAQAQQLVAVFTPGATPFAWTDGDYQRPPMEDLVIYEMLVRDWVSRHDFQTIRDSLGYLERLGVTALQLMPVSEFDGNESWGYNPNHYLAVDKYYGPPEALKALINEAHRRGMAVLLDVVYNHQTGQSPFVRLYNEGLFGPPTAANPWVNPTARHPFNVFNDNNHEAELTRYWLDIANRWWLEEYRVDGFRFDLSKGFTQLCNGQPCNDANFSAYNQARINILTRMADAIWDADPSAYVILEHFADWSEERVLANHGRAQGRPGMALWNNMTGAYSESAMGYLNSGSDLRRAYPINNTFPLSGQVSYMESHDEQWLMFKTRAFGACANAPTGGATCATNPGNYSTRTLAGALGRQSLAAAFFLTVPGPKMLWQFGELGYGGGPGECLESTDCPAGTPGRVQNKPIRWDYFAPVPPASNNSGVTVTAATADERALRRQTYTDYSNLLALRNTYDVFRTPATVTMSVGQNIVDRWIKLQRDGLSVVVVGNFGVAERTSTPPLDAGQTWYDMIGDGTVDGGSALTLAPGAWRVLANQDIGLPTADGDAPGPVLAFGLGAAFPNPAAGRATVRYTLDAPADVQLHAYDVLGRRVATLDDGPRAAGAHTATLDTRALPAGVYVLRLTADGRTASSRLTIAR
jgi:glycosidase